MGRTLQGLNLFACPIPSPHDIILVIIDMYYVPYGKVSMFLKKGEKYKDAKFIGHGDDFKKGYAEGADEVFDG